MTPVEKPWSCLLNSCGLLVWHLLTFLLGPSILVALPTIVTLGVLPCSVVPLRYEPNAVPVTLGWRALGCLLD